MLRLFALALVFAAPFASAQTRPARDCRDGWDVEGDAGRTSCITREFVLAPRAAVRLDAGPYGGVRAEAWDRPEIGLSVVVVATAPTDAAAERLAAAVGVDTSATIRPRLPAREPDSYVQTSFRLRVPRTTDLDLRANSGAVRIDSVSGAIAFETRNGAVRLSGLAGDVRGRTRNGALWVDLAGATWDGAGLDVETANGAVRLNVPGGYSADLETGTANGRLRLGFPITVEGDVGRRVRATLGRGGPPVRVVTRNGAVAVNSIDA